MRAIAKHAARKLRIVFPDGGFAVRYILLPARLLVKLGYSRRARLSHWRRTGRFALGCARSCSRDLQNGNLERGVALRAVEVCASGNFVLTEEVGAIEAAVAVLGMAHGITHIGNVPIQAEYVPESQVPGAAPSSRVDGGVMPAHSQMPRRAGFRPSSKVG